jgi:hypothetical protein
MLIGLHDAEKEHLKGKTFPNYVLMKISAWHKAQGDTVEWWDSSKRYDRVYSSKVFDFTPENPDLPPDTIKGGTGYDVKSKLPDKIDRKFPDYRIYPECDYAIGYLTRGCPNNCRWCVVPEKEGGIQAYQAWGRITRLDSRKLVLMDNNILASKFGVEQLRAISRYPKGDERHIQIDINQGLDARLVTTDIADILAKIHWIKYIRFSCDSKAQIGAIANAVKMLKERGVSPSRIFIYLLVTPDIEDAAYRVDELRQLGAITIYAQPERNERLGIVPNQMQKYFAGRYVYRGIWRKETWTEYLARSNYYKEGAEQDDKQNGAV